MGKSRQKHSPLWKFFDEIQPHAKAQCTYCGRVLAITSGSLGNLGRHLRNIHPQLVESKIDDQSYNKYVDPLKPDLNGFEFISSIQNHHCLWKLDSEEYRNKQLKDEAWATVADEHSMSVSEAQHAWRKLRSGFQRAVHTSNGENWKYEEHMNFLLPYTKPLKEHNKIPKEEVLEATQYIIESLEDEDTTIVNDCNTTSRKSVEDTTLKKFFILIHETAEELPEDLQLRVQRQLFNIVMEAKEEHMNRKEMEKSRVRRSSDDI